MPLRILELGKQFRPGTSQVYPPFKNGRYMEEYFYDYVLANKDKIETDYVYIPIFWTNLQNHPGFSKQKQNYDILLSRAFKQYPQDTKFFIVVQHDDGPQLTLPTNTIIFGACTGSIPLPLIYEDTTNTLINKNQTNNKEYFATFVGTLTHPIRNQMTNILQNKEDTKLITKPHNEWTNNISSESATSFVDLTLKSRFCLAPRGYGRSSFRFFEAMLLNVVPVYFWDDIEWLPYKEMIDYSKFSVSIKEIDILNTYTILKSISEEKYQSMLLEIKRVSRHFTLEGMSEYIFNKIKV
jgi:hypothetical protein